MSTLNIGGRLLDLSSPKVMGILNVTPDSFYAGSRTQDEEAVIQRARQIENEGGDFIDIGAYSSRPGAGEVSEAAEMERLRMGLSAIHKSGTKLPVSVDTFRSGVAKMCVEEYGANIINDISGGELDSQMFPTIAHLKVPYILMHMKGNPHNMQQKVQYSDLMGDLFLYLSRKVNELNLLGVSDIILDPGFGFAKTLEQNYELMDKLEDFEEFHLPLLVGISRKSMIYKLLGNSSEEALNGTTVLNTIALLKGADILRVHDVRACKETVQIVEKMKAEGGQHD